MDELDKDSDYTPFLADGVPQDLARMALRKLWRSDPVFAFRDGLDDYDEDYTIIDKILTAVDEGSKRIGQAQEEEAGEEGTSSPSEPTESVEDANSQPAASDTPAVGETEDGSEKKIAAAPAGGKMDTGGENVVSEGSAATAAAEKLPRSNGDVSK